jgi:glycosyltransferase involved in cell wall biosynthesis
MITSPYFSIIIPAHNEEYRIGKLLTSIGKQTFRNFELIVSDSASEDDTGIIVESHRHSIPSLVHLQNKTANVGAARNNGAKYARGEYLVFLDADVVIEDHFLKAIMRHIQAEHPPMMTMWNRPSPPSWRGRLIFGVMNRLVQALQYSRPAANGPCIVIKKSLFNSIGGFDESIFFGEDYDIVKRAHAKGGFLRVYKNPLLFVSTRRFDQEGLIVSLYKSITALLYQFFFGPVRKPIFKYEMGGQYYKNK